MILLTISYNIVILWSLVSHSKPLSGIYKYSNARLYNIANYNACVHVQSFRCVLALARFTHKCVQLLINWIWLKTYHSLCIKMTRCED